jgi:ATP/ADP translocase
MCLTWWITPFISQVKNKFVSVTELAGFITIFGAMGRLIALILKLIFTSRLIERLGLISCLFITPVALVLFCSVFLFTGNYSDYNMYLFGIMALLTEVLRSTMQEPVFFILFQPLKEQLRLKGHIISKGYMFAPSLDYCRFYVAYNAKL